MKTCAMLTLSVLLALFTVNNAFAGAAIKIGFDLEGEHEIDGEGFNGTEDVDTGISVSGEVFTSIGKNMDIGGGIVIIFLN